jgi:hypothetical protein
MAFSDDPRRVDPVAQEIGEVAAHLARLAGLRGVEFEKTESTFRELRRILAPFGDFGRRGLLESARDLADREGRLSAAMRILDEKITHQAASRSFKEGTSVTPIEFAEAIAHFWRKERDELDKSGAEAWRQVRARQGEILELVARVKALEAAAAQGFDPNKVAAI